MNKSQWIYAALLVDYVAVSAWAIFQTSLSEIVQTVTSPIGLQMTAELLLFFGLAAAYIWRDATKLKLSRKWAWMAMTGVFGVLIYLIRRDALTDESAPQGQLAVS